MEINIFKAIIEAMLFASGRPVEKKEIMLNLELSEEDTDLIMQSLKQDYENEQRGIEIVKMDNTYQLCTKSKYYDYVCSILDNRSKPSLSNAAMETLSIIAYNPKITRAEIESIRGVNTDGTIYKLLEYNLIEEAGRLDLPGRPTTYRTTNEFLKMFGISSLDELPELPRYKMDENEQIVIDDLIDTQKQESTNDDKKEEPINEESTEE